jgi:hypothetical protein
MLSFVVPAHNEQACLGRTVQAIHTAAVRRTVDCLMRGGDSGFSDDPGVPDCPVDGDKFSSTMCRNLSGNGHHREAVLDTVPIPVPTRKAKPIPRGDDAVPTDRRFLPPRIGLPPPYDSAG